MPVASRINSIADVARNSPSKEQFSYALRDFLDGFYEKPEADKLALEPLPLKIELNDSGYADAYLAATAEHLSRQFALPIPSWTEDHIRFLKEPVFAFKTTEGQMFLIVESPTAFRRRNIFVSADALTRV
jgi:hypothetical protein